MSSTAAISGKRFESKKILSNSGTSQKLPIYSSFHASHSEQIQNPDALVQALKYHMYSMMRVPLSFKPITTEETIKEETEEIDRLALGECFEVVSFMFVHYLLDFNLV